MLTTPVIVDDIDSPEQLITYATVGQVAFAAQLQPHPITLTALADTMSMAPQNLAAKFRPTRPDRVTPRAPTFDALRELDSAMVTLASEVSGAGGLVAFANRLNRLVGRKSFGASVEPSWTDDLLALLGERPEPVGVLMQASTLLSRLGGARNREDSIIAEHSERLDWVVRRLIYIGVSPPTRRSIEALILLGSLGAYDFDHLKAPLDQTLDGPMGFRAWRSITSIVLAASDMKSASATQRRRLPRLIDWVGKSLGRADELRKQSIYPARSLDLELAVAIPDHWDKTVGAAADRLLRSRAEMADATVRERAMAAHGLWERAVRQGRHRQEHQHVLALAELFEQQARQRNNHTGLRWTASTLRAVVEREQRVCNEWPDFDGPFRDVVESATSKLDQVPAALRDATKFLFRQALLQNAGVSRRRAVDTLRVGGWVVPVTEAFGKVLEEAQEPWIRTRALFALGFMQVRGAFVQTVFAEACERAFNALDGSHERTSEMHAVIFALGDCYGAAEAAPQDVRRMLRAVQNIVEDLVEKTLTQDELYPVARALVYLIAVTAPVNPVRSRELLETLANHSDRETHRFSVWAINGLFQGYPDSAVLPLHAIDIDPRDRLGR